MNKDNARHVVKYAKEVDLLLIHVMFIAYKCQFQLALLNKIHTFCVCE